MDNNTIQPIDVDFSEQSPYFDNVYQGIFVTVTGHVKVASQEWGNDARAVEHVKNIIKLELAQQLQMCSSKRKSVKKLTEEIPAMHEACVNQLMSKKFQVYDFDITSITPNDEKLTTVDKLDLDLDVVMNVMTKICPLSGNKNPDVKICKFCGGHLK